MTTRTDEPAASELVGTFGLFPADMPRPRADDLTAPYWEACAGHQLVIQQCGACGHHRHLPTRICPRCQSDSFGWDPSAGTGRIYSHVTVHHPAHAAVRDVVPYSVVVVRLDDCDGVLIVSNLVGVAPDDIEIDTPVHVVWDDLDDGVSLYRFAVSEPAVSEPAGGAR